MACRIPIIARAVDLAALDGALLEFKAAHPGVSLWIEPGRYLVAVGGVLLARVTQLKQKGAQGYVGVATGMNALIRPALYGAFHEIVNLVATRTSPASAATTWSGPSAKAATCWGTTGCCRRRVKAMCC